MAVLILAKARRSCDLPSQRKRKKKPYLLSLPPTPSSFFIILDLDNSQTLHRLFCLCVCVCEWERERERFVPAWTLSQLRLRFSHLFFFSLIVSPSSPSLSPSSSRQSYLLSLSLSPTGSMKPHCCSFYHSSDTLLPLLTHHLISFSEVCLCSPPLFYAITVGLEGYSPRIGVYAAN